LICHRGCSFQESAELNDMHELRIAADLSEIVLEVSGREKLSKVTQVNISFGQMIQIVPDIFNAAFEEAVKDTVAGDAIVNIEILPVKMRCKNCTAEFGITENIFRCTGCGSDDLELIQGKELFIKSIEGE
jgi:hydrogenase nickel incorporation protein HypA/HybF